MVQASAPGDALYYLLYIQMVVQFVPPKHSASPREKSLALAMEGDAVGYLYPALSRRSQFRSLASLCLPYTKPPLGQFKA